MKKYKGILLAGGTGSRLYPATSLYNKQMITVYDKPMIYYSLSTLMMADIREILIISDGESLKMYRQLLKNGHHLGMQIEYAEQKEPKGIAEALIIGKEFLNNQGVVLMLGDNLFYGYLNFLRDSLNNNKHATVFGYYVKNPEEYGIVSFNNDGKPVKIEEKPDQPNSNYAIVGCYIFDNNAVKYALQISPSSRGELEITDVVNCYLKQNKLHVQKLGRGIAWLDSGTPKALVDAGNFFATIEERQGLKIGCIEEIAIRRKFINYSQLIDIINTLPTCQYKEYLIMVAQEYKDY